MGLVTQPLFHGRGDFSVLGLLQHVDVFVSYSHYQHPRFKAVLTARVASLSALMSLSFPLPVFSYEYLLQYLIVCKNRAVSSTVERLPYKQDVTGSNPVLPIRVLGEIISGFDT